MFVLSGGSLLVEQAGDNLQVVFDPMIDFLEQGFFFFEGGLDALIGLFVRGDIFTVQVYGINGRDRMISPRKDAILCGNFNPPATLSILQTGSYQV